MVQRKVLNNLGIKVDHHIKANKQFINHKPSSPISLNHDIKKKMMKKSGKTKLSEYEICQTPKKHVPQPGKPPTSTPNYMKSTNSSVARKEQSQVSLRSPQTYSKSCSRKNSSNSKLGSASSVNKPTRSLLARTPSFKPVRVSAKKSCSPTCSSTLKEAKFPSFLELSPGGTESDGTSVFKVCTYTYCSLNGHHHPPLPPLKCFMSARRRTLKTQRNFKLGCLSPRRANQHGLVPKQIQNTTEVAPVTNEDDREFFVEIYSKEREEMDDTVGEKTNSVDDYNIIDSSEAISAEINSPGFCPEEKLKEGVGEEIYMPPMVQEVDYESWTMHTELEIESEASEMDWNVEKYYAYSEDEIGSISNDIDPITLVDDSVVSEEYMAKLDELLSDNTLEESSSDKESIISGTSYGYNDSESTCSHTEFDIDECVEASDDTSFNSLNVTFILDGEITEKTEEQAAVKGEETFCLEDEISTSQEECITLQDDDATALIGYQELNVCYLNEVQDETCEDNETSSDENIVVKMENVETKTDCWEQENENGHGNNDNKQLVVEADLKCETSEDETSHQAEDGTENTSGVEVDQTSEACVGKLNQIKDNKRRAKYDSNEELSESYKKLRGIARRNDTEEAEESREFNPRPPNFLPVEADPNAEKVDLKHQIMDDRKNAEDWMLDFALRRAVDKLTPARKRKVALLVEAFETVIPTSKWEPHLRRSASGFAHPRPIQACN